eukprot:11918660-Ditylum_brightwellii.AAC.1
MPHHLEHGEWPQHSNTNKKDRRIRQRTLTAMVCNEEGYLHQPLGDWLITHKRWEHSSDSNPLYRKIDKKWVAHAVKERKRTKVRYTHVGIVVDIPPPKCLPITDTKINRRTWESSGPAELEIAQVEQPWHNSFQEYIQTLDTCGKRLLKHVVEKHESYASLKAHLQLRDKLWMVMDGEMYAKN